jgi:hypothetical protein
MSSREFDQTTKKNGKETVPDSKQSDKKTTLLHKIERIRFRGVARVLLCDVVVGGKTNAVSL